MTKLHEPPHNRKSANLGCHHAVLLLCLGGMGAAVQQRSTCRSGSSQSLVCSGQSPAVFHHFKSQFVLWSSRSICYWLRRTLAYPWARWQVSCFHLWCCYRCHTQGPSARGYLTKQRCHGLFSGHRVNELCLHMWKCNMLLNGWKLLMGAPVIHYSQQWHISR